MEIHDEKLKAIAAQLKDGVAPSRETVRTFLGWFGAERRGSNTVALIRARLGEHKLATEPDFEYQYIDGLIGFIAAESQETNETDRAAQDPTYRVGRLASANTPPIAVTPDSTLSKTVTLMLTKDFSQVPVMSGTRDVKGIVSWKTIGSHLALKGKEDCGAARSCMEAAKIISIEESLFSAISIIAEHDYVLVRANDQQICGIITASDFNEQFRKLAEPFLLVGEIENGVRRMLRGKFTSSELKAAKSPGEDSREVNAVSDLTFGEYMRLVEPEKHWRKLKLEIDRVEFIKRLDEIRNIRNDVMHFDPEGLEEKHLTTLREFAQFLKRLRDVGAM